MPDHKPLARARRKPETSDSELVSIRMSEYKLKNYKSGIINKGLQVYEEIPLDVLGSTTSDNDILPTIKIDAVSTPETNRKHSIPGTPEVLRQTCCKAGYLSPESVDSGFESARLSSHNGSIRSGSTLDDILRRDSSSTSLCSFDTTDAGRAFHERFLDPADDNISIASFYSVSSAVRLDDRKSDDLHDVFLHNRFGRRGNDIAEIRNATSVAHVYAGTVLVTDMLNSRILLFTRQGYHKMSLPLGNHAEPWAAVVNPHGTLAVTIARESCVKVISGTGDILKRFGDGILKRPSGLAVDRKGRYIVSDVESNQVFVLDRLGKVLRVLGNDEAGPKTSTQSDNADISADVDRVIFDQPRYVCVSRKGEIIVSDSGNHCIKMFDSSGKFIRKFGEYGRKDGQLKFPYGVCSDKENNIIVADHYNNRVCMFGEDGTFIQHLVTAEKGLCRPQGISMKFGHDPRLYVTHGDLRAHEVLCYKVIDPTYSCTVEVKSFV
ncbi:hypothetical protein ScPMuIL_012380 [Solemya velum]